MTGLSQASTIPLRKIGVSRVGDIRNWKAQRKHGRNLGTKPLIATFGYYKSWALGPADPNQSVSITAKMPEASMLITNRHPGVMNEIDRHVPAGCPPGFRLKFVKARSVADITKKMARAYNDVYADIFLNDRFVSGTGGTIV